LREQAAAIRLEVPNPVIVVEVLSPSTRHIDLRRSWQTISACPASRTNLIVDPAKPRIIHHARSAGDAILTRIVNDGRITLDPPGIELRWRHLFPSDVARAESAA